MSRAYRITVKESETRQLKGSDEICTHLELLEILPGDQMAELLRGELKNRGFEEVDDGRLTRTDGKITVTVDPCSGEVSVKSEESAEVKLEAQRDATGYDDVGMGQAAMRERARGQLKEVLDKKAEAEAGKLQAKATEALEKHLDELQPELGQVVNKVTRDALKQKAAQLGSIKEISEDAESGSLTIKVEV